MWDTVSERLHMRATPLKTAATRVLPMPLRGQETRVAVLLNAHARKVDETVIRAIRHIVADEDLFISRSDLDARRIAQTVLDRRYATVFTGGGDGTFMGFVNAMLNEAKQRRFHLSQKVPRIGVLKLGTGNALASLLKASPIRGGAYLNDILRAQSGEVPNFKPLNLLEVDGKRAPFAGVGVDAKLLNDYVWVKQNWALGPLKRALTGSRGYFASVALRTVPHYLLNSSAVNCEVINSSRTPAYRLNPEGKPFGPPIPPNGILFSGPLMMVSAGTVPCLGFGLKMFPFADSQSRMMHVRLGSFSTGSVLTHLPKLWTGHYFPESLHDFHAQSIHIRYAKPMPLQVGGDAEGFRDEIKISLAPEQLELIDFAGVVN